MFAVGAADCFRLHVRLGDSPMNRRSNRCTHRFSSRACAESGRGVPRRAAVYGEFPEAKMAPPGPANMAGNINRLLINATVSMEIIMMPKLRVGTNGLSAKTPARYRSPPSFDTWLAHNRGRRA